MELICENLYLGNASDAQNSMPKIQEYMYLLDEEQKETL